MQKYDGRKYSWNMGNMASLIYLKLFWIWNWSNYIIFVCWSCSELFNFYWFWDLLKYYRKLYRCMTIYIFFQNWEIRRWQKMEWNILWIWMLWKLLEQFLKSKDHFGPYTKLFLLFFFGIWYYFNCRDRNWWNTLYLII